MKTIVPSLLNSINTRLKLAYCIRVIYYLFALSIVWLSNFEKHNLLIKAVMLVWLIAWPNIALLSAHALKNLKIFSKNMVLIDAFVIGCLITLLQFSPSPIIGLLASFVISVTYFYGPVYLLSCFSSMLIGLFISGLFYGFGFQLETTITISIVSTIMTLIFVGVLGSVQYQILLREEEKKEQSMKKSEELEEIAEVVKIASSYVQLDELLNAIIKPLQKIFPFESLAIQLIDENDLLYMYMIYGETVDQKIIEQVKKVKISVNSKDSISNYVIHNKKPFYTKRIDPRDEMPPGDKQLYNLVRSMSVLILPIEVNDKVIGCIAFYSHTKEFSLTQDDIELIVRYVYPISNVIQNAKKYEESRQVNKKIRALYDEAQDKQKALELKTEQLKGLSKKLSRYLSPQVYNAIFSSEEDVGEKTGLGNYRKFLSIFYCEIYGFTSMTDSVESELSALVLNSYINKMSEVAVSYGGTIDKFIGDKIIVFFGDPQTQGKEKDALNCVLMALEMKKQMKSLKRMWFENGVTKKLYFKAGINTGYCNVGNFGGKTRLEYSVLGNHVNITERLMHQAKSDQILISQETDALIQDVVYCEQRGSIKLKGMEKKINIYEPIDQYKNIDEHEAILKNQMPGFSLDVHYDRISDEDKDKIIETIDKTIEMLNKN